MVYLTRRERFSAAHKLWVEDWNEQKNIDVFGKCANPNWHGHNYQLLVTVKGEPDIVTGFVTDLRKLRDIIRETVIQKMDHKNLDLDTDFIHGKMTTTENLAVAIWEQLLEPVTELGTELHCVKLQETENNSAEYFG